MIRGKYVKLEGGWGTPAGGGVEGNSKMLAPCAKQVVFYGWQWAEN